MFMQQVDFSYEIIAVNDASQDRTAGILQEYANKHESLKIITHNKNQGNAISFYDGLTAASGDYFCVLDGDDYYTVKNKLQKQVDFLDSDKQQKFVAVSHKYLTVNSEFNVLDEEQLFSGERTLYYHDFLQNKFYSHTSTYMYRNIFKGNVPAKFKEPLYRGDNPRTFMMLFYTKGMVKNLNFVGSVYFVNGKGIWTSTTEKQQKERNKVMLQTFAQNFQSKIELNLWNSSPKNVPTQFKSYSYQYKKPEFVLDIAQSMASKFAFNNMDFIFQNLYKSEFLDSLCESLGFVEMVKRGFRPFKPVISNNRNICILVSNLTTTGGGVYHEIKDIINMYSEKNVYILWTDVDKEENLDQSVLAELKQFKNLRNIFGQTNNDGKLNKLFDKLLNIKPCKIYPYCGRNNVYASCLIQSMLAKNICIFSFDHGLSLGLDNSCYDTYITKRPSDYEVLSSNYKDKVVFIPCWNREKLCTKKYVPFKNHTKLITACAAARFYKIAGRGADAYINLVLALMQKTGGKHIHYGPIPETDIQYIHEQMDKIGIERDRFVIIPWTDNLPQSMCDNEVDIFIEPFPVVSYKITLDVLSAGIPVVSRKGNTRISLTDFVYDKALFWKDKDDFLDVLTHIDADDLAKQSIAARNYYVKNHSLEVLQPYFCEEKQYKMPSLCDFYDKSVIDVSNVVDILDASNVHVPKRKYPKFITNLRLDKRIREFAFGLLLSLSQVPVIDLLFRSEKRKKLLQKIIKYYR